MNTRYHILVPVADRDTANAYLEALGWGPNNFSVPVATSPDAATITHYAGSGVYTDEQLAVVDDLQTAVPSVHTHDASLSFDDWLSSLTLSRQMLDPVVAE